MKNKQRTYGELRTKKILSALPSDKYLCFDEPRIDGPQGTVRYPDFVIVVLSRGVIAVEVKDWKKIDIDNSDQDRIKIIFPNGEIKYKENPHRTAKNYSYNLINIFEKRRELLSSHRDIEKLRFPCEGIVIFPHLDKTMINKMEQAGIFPGKMVFPAEALTSPEEFINHLNQITWTWILRSPIEKSTLEIITKTLALKDVRSNKPEQKIGDLNKKQEEVIFAPLPIKDGGHSIDLLRGSVGSGKTIVLTKRAELLAECRPELKILATTFQIDLTDDLRKRIKNKNIKVMKFYDICKEILGDKWPKNDSYRGEPGPTTIKKWIKGLVDCESECNLDPEIVAQEIARRKDISLKTETDYLEDIRERGEKFSRNQVDFLNTIYDIYVDYQERSQSEGNEVYDFEDIPDLTLKMLFGHKLERSFDVILVDEAQDFAPKWIKIILRLLKPGGYLFLCDDPAQSLWRRYNWEQRGIKNPNIFFLELPERTTSQIMTFAQCLFDIDERLHVDFDMDVYPVKTDHLLQGDKPLVIIYKDIDNEMRDIISKIEAKLSEGTLQSDIGILCTNSDDSKEWKKNPFVAQYQIYVAHFNFMKGLEFDTVVIPHLCHSFNDRKDINLLRKLFVAITRAKKNVILTTYGDFPEIISPMLNYARIERKG